MNTGLIQACALNLQTPSYAILFLSSIVSCLYDILAAHLLFLARKQGVDGRVELITALQEVELEYEDVFQDLAAELLDKCTGGGCRATCVR